MADVSGVFYPYALFMESLVEGLVDFEADVFYMMLTDAGYLPNQHTHKFKSVVSNEVTYSGYAAGGMQMSISTISYTMTTKRLAITASNVQWPLVNFLAPGARYGVVYDRTTKSGSGSSSAMPLVGYVDFGSAQILADQAFHVNWPPTGMLMIELPTP